MLKTLKNVTDRLVDYYKPDRIILFGSYGRKEFEKRLRYRLAYY